MDRYPFCLFRIPENGGRILWEITNTCNYNCAYCIFSSSNKVDKMELSYNEVLSVLQQLKNKHFTHIKFTGGEPFVRQDMINILQESKKLGFCVDISTNGSLITKDKAKALRDINFDMIHISLDGFNAETHEKARGKNTFYPTIKGIRNVVKEGIYTRLGTLIYKDNENQLENMIIFASELGVNEIIFSFMEAVGRLEGNSTLISNRVIEDVKQELVLLKEKYKDKILIKYSFTENIDNECNEHCPAISKFLYINNLGNVSPCTWVIEKDKKYISELTLKDNTLEQILESEPITSYANYVLDNNIKGCPVKTRI